ncbi:hypothetical protein ACB092_01G125400 [Castanea dentata]
MDNPSDTIVEIREELMVSSMGGNPTLRIADPDSLSSRLRKQKQLEDLTDEVTRLQLSNRDLVQKINAKERNYGAIECANNVLRAQHAELTDRLRSLNSVLQMIEEMSGFSVDIPEIPDSIMNPWQLNRPIQPIMADMFLP